MNEEFVRIMNEESSMTIDELRMMKILLAIWSLAS